MIRLAIVEDHPAIAEGLTALLRGEPDVTVVGTAQDGVAADRLIETQAPDVILCDIRLAGTVDGLDVLARHTPGPAFIMLSAYSYPSYYAAAVEHGAKGYLSKMATIAQILTAVRTVAAGGDEVGAVVLGRDVATDLSEVGGAQAEPRGTEGGVGGGSTGRHGVVRAEFGQQADDVRALRRAPRARA